MKKTSFSIIFVVLLAVALLKPYYPVLDYLINYKYISTVLCVNKDKPEMHCNGKCHLVKQMRQSNNENSSNPFPVISFELKIFTPCENYQELQQIATNQSPIISFSHVTYHFDFSKSIFHPPSFSYNPC